MGLPVPHGFVISTEACKEFLAQSDQSVLEEHLNVEIERSVRELERQTGKIFGIQPSMATHDLKSYSLPLLISVRSGASVSMPGMMDTILNLGINETLIHVMARVSNNIRWTYDTYRRFLQMFGTVVLQIDNEKYEKILEEARMKRGVEHDSLLTDSDLIHVVNQFKTFTMVPEDPWEQLKMAVKAVFLSWNSPRAIKYRDIHNIPQDLGTAVVIQSMVYGNLNIRSGSGVAFTRNPATGEKAIFGEYLANAEGEDVVAGVRTPMKLIDLGNDQPSVYDTLTHIAKLLEMHYRDMQVSCEISVIL
jgi:pyruvate,orthophosphate dikinase